MKISQLKKIIREEIKHSLNEGGQGVQARSTAKELQKNLKDIRANGFDQDKYKKLITSIPAALADLAKTLGNMPKTAPNGTEAEELATAILILWDFSDEGMSHGFDADFSKADRYLRWVRMYLEAYEEGDTGRIHGMLAKQKDNLTGIFQKAAKVVASLKTDDSQNVFR
jgi:hypothetical protein